MRLTSFTTIVNSLGAVERLKGKAVNWKVFTLEPQILLRILAFGDLKVGVALEEILFAVI